MGGKLNIQTVDQEANQHDVAIGRIWIKTKGAVC